MGVFKLLTIFFSLFFLASCGREYIFISEIKKLEIGEELTIGKLDLGIGISKKREGAFIVDNLIFDCLTKSEKVHNPGLWDEEYLMYSFSSKLYLKLYMEKGAVKYYESLQNESSTGLLQPTGSLFFSNCNIEMIDRKLVYVY